MAGADYGVWPRVWARYPDDGKWHVVPLHSRGRARQLAALLATHTHGIHATDAERLLAGGGPETRGVGRHARDTLHETLAQEGLADLFPLNDRGGPDQEAWELLHATTDVNVAGAAVAAGDWPLASRLTDEGRGFLVTFPEHGQRDHARRRLSLGGQVADDVNAEVVGIPLPADLVADARQVAEQVRRQLAVVLEPPPEQPHSPPDAVSPPDGGEDEDSELVVGRRPAVPESAPDTRPVSPQAVVLQVSDPGGETVLLAVIPLSALPPRRPPLPRRTRRPVLAGAAFAVAAVAVILVLVLGSPGGSGSHGRRYARHVLLNVENVDTSGAKATVEDKSPLRLASRPAVFCGPKHCLIFKTEREHGQVYDGAICQTVGERTTNGSDESKVDDHNPQLRSTRRYYGVELTDGTIGYVSAAWLSNRDRSGLGLPSCISLVPIPSPGRAALIAAAAAP